MDRWQYGHYARHFILFLRQKLWLLWQPKNNDLKMVEFLTNFGAGRGPYCLTIALFIFVIFYQLTDFRVEKGSVNAPMIV